MIANPRIALALSATLPLFVGCSGDAPQTSTSTIASQVGARRATSAPPQIARHATTPLARTLDHRAPGAKGGAGLLPPSPTTNDLHLPSWVYPPPPQVLPGTASTMHTPRVLPVYFTGQTYRDQIDAFYHKVGSSHYWSAALGEYGVGPLTVADPVTLSQTLPPLDGVGAYEWQTSTVASLGPLDANTIVSFVVPRIPDGVDPHGLCKSYGGYHGAVSLPSGQSVPVIWVGTCTDYLPGVEGIDDVTLSLSHELAETVTDSFIDPTAIGYVNVNWQASGWAAACEGDPYSEVGDMCEFQPDANLKDPELGFMVQRIWSNKAAAGWHNPCAPAAPGPYFSVQSILGGTRSGFNVGSFSTGVSIPPGGKATIPVRLYADGPMPAWSLSAEEVFNPHLTPDTHHLLTFSWDRPKGRDGDIRFLTIQRAPLPPGAPNPFLRVALTSTYGDKKNVSWLVVGQ